MSTNRSSRVRAPQGSQLVLRPSSGSTVSVPLGRLTASPHLPRGHSSILHEATTTIHRPSRITANVRPTSSMGPLEPFLCVSTREKGPTGSS